MSVINTFFSSNFSIKVLNVNILIEWVPFLHNFTQLSSICRIGSHL